MQELVFGWPISEAEMTTLIKGCAVAVKDFSLESLFLAVENKWRIGATLFITKWRQPPIKSCKWQKFTAIQLLSIMAKPLFRGYNSSKYLLLIVWSTNNDGLPFFSFNEGVAETNHPELKIRMNPPSQLDALRQETIHFNNNMSEWSVRDCKSSRNWSGNYYQWVGSVINAYIQCNKLIIKWIWWWI